MNGGMPYHKAHKIALKFEKNAFLKSHTNKDWNKYEKHIDRVYVKENSGGRKRKGQTLSPVSQLIRTAKLIPEGRFITKARRKKLNKFLKKKGIKGKPVLAFGLVDQTDNLVEIVGITKTKRKWHKFARIGRKSTY